MIVYQLYYLVEECVTMNEKFPFLENNLPVDWGFQRNQENAKSRTLLGAYMGLQGSCKGIGRRLYYLQIGVEVPLVVLNTCTPRILIHFHCIPLTSFLLLEMSPFLRFLLN